MKLGTLNCRGLKFDLKERQLCTDLETYNLDFLAVQETHRSDIGNIRLESLKQRKYRFFQSGVAVNKGRINAGVGILVSDNDLECTLHQ